MTLLEISIAITVLVMGMLASMQAMVFLERSQQKTREVARATQAARQVLERIQAEAFPEAFRRYNDDASDDPGTGGTAPGKHFAVLGLSPRPGDPDGMAGEIVFPTPPGQPTVLRESIANPRIGMPRDLDGDGYVDSTTNCALTYKILPVLARVQWTGAAGPAEVELRTMLGNY